jgi:GAF domain-containing protein
MEWAAPLQPRADSNYRYFASHAYAPRMRALLDRYGFRASLAVPLLREERIIGALVVRRKSTGEFRPEVVELLKTFATQSVLAIQNARLFREMKTRPADRGGQSPQVGISCQHVA